MISYSRLSACALLGPLHGVCNGNSMCLLPHMINLLQANKFQIKKAIMSQAQLLPEGYFRALSKAIDLRLRTRVQRQSIIPPVNMVHIGWVKLPISLSWRVLSWARALS